MTKRDTKAENAFRDRLVYTLIRDFSEGDQVTAKDVSRRVSETFDFLGGIQAQTNTKELEERLSRQAETIGRDQEKIRDLDAAVSHQGDKIVDLDDQCCVLREKNSKLYNHNIRLEKLLSTAEKGRDEWRVKAEAKRAAYSVPTFQGVPLTEEQLTPPSPLAAVQPQKEKSMLKRVAKVSAVAAVLLVGVPFLYQTGKSAWSDTLADFTPEERTIQQELDALFLEQTELASDLADAMIRAESEREKEALMAELREAFEQGAENLEATLAAYTE
jgi:small-conductance mechanosensitive channel